MGGVKESSAGAWKKEVETRGREDRSEGGEKCRREEEGTEESN